jgi:LPXTG-motif cell wall-anchored protein
MNASQVAITVGNGGVSKTDQDHIFNFNSQYTYKTPKGEQLTFKVNTKGGVTVDRQTNGETNHTSFDQSGKLTAETKDMTSDGLISQQNDVIDGMKSVITSEQFRQTLSDGYVIDAERKIDLNHVSRQEKPEEQQVPNTTLKNNKDSSTDSVIQSAPAKATIMDPQSATNKTRTQVSDIGQAKTQALRGDQPVSLLEAATSIDSRPVQQGADDSFNLGIPLTTPTFVNDQDISPNNNALAGAKPVESSELTAVSLSQHGKILYQGTLLNQQEKNTYASPDKELEIDAGADHDGFYVDTFNGNKGMAYTMGSGYAWAAVKNDLPEPKDSTTSTSTAVTSKDDNLGNRTLPASMTRGISSATTENSNDPNRQTSSGDHLKHMNKSDIRRPNLLARLLPKTGQRQQIGLVVLGVVILIVSVVAYLKRHKRGKV